MAQGQGEHLTALAMLLGVPPDHQEMFFSLAQERYREFTSRGETSQNASIKALGESIKGNPILAKVEAAH